MSNIYRVIDANLNRSREALRVAEEYARFIINDARMSFLAKQLRSDLQLAASQLDSAQLLAARNTSGDVGTAINSSTESVRQSSLAVATAACKRLTEALRAIEEFSKQVAPETAAKFEALRYRAYDFEQLLIARGEIIGKFSSVKLYLLLTTGLCKLDPIVTAHSAIAGGIGGIQLREKNMASGQFVNLARQLRAITRDADVLFIVNDRPDIAALSDADGVHIGQDDLNIEDTRRIIGGDKLIGVSTHSADQATRAQQAGADYIGVGPMFQTATKSAEPVKGPGLLNDILSLNLNIPHVEIGGINCDNAGELYRSGAKCLAVCSAIISADDPEAASRKILSQAGN